MEQITVPIITAPVQSDGAGDGVCRGIVPAPAPSTSNNGPSAACTTGATLDMATVETDTNPDRMTEDGQPASAGLVPNKDHRSQSADTIIMGGTSTPSPRPNPAPNPNPTSPFTLNPGSIYPGPSTPSDMAPAGQSSSEVQSWIDLAAEEKDRVWECSDIEMDTEEGGPTTRSQTSKRKNRQMIEADSPDEDGSEICSVNTRKLRAVKKRAVAATEQRTESRLDISAGIAAAEESVPLPMQEPIPSGSDTDSRKGGRPKRKVKAIDPILAEQAILNKTGTAPDEVRTELLSCMTPSDICAQALEYLNVIEIIRSKSGRLQGGLSGELRRRIQGLEGFVRALQTKTEATGDPQILQSRIEELIKEVKEYRREKERRNREVNDLQEIIRDLKKENKEIREEMRRAFKEIRASIGKDDKVGIKSKEDNKEDKDGSGRTGPGEAPLPQRARRNRADTSISKSTIPESNMEWPALQGQEVMDYEGGYVWRPPLQGKQALIPVKEDVCFAKCG